MLPTNKSLRFVTDRALIWPKCPTLQKEKKLFGFSVRVRRLARLFFFNSHGSYWIAVHCTVAEYVNKETKDSEASKCVNKETKDSEASECELKIKDGLGGVRMCENDLVAWCHSLDSSVPCFGTIYVYE